MWSPAVLGLLLVGFGAFGYWAARFTTVRYGATRGIAMRPALGAAIVLGLALVIARQWLPLPVTMGLVGSVLLVWAGTRSSQAASQRLTLSPEIRAIGPFISLAKGLLGGGAMVGLLFLNEGLSARKHGAWAITVGAWSMLLLCGAVGLGFWDDRVDKLRNPHWRPISSRGGRIAKLVPWIIAALTISGIILAIWVQSL